MASGDTLAVFTALHNEPPASNGARLDLRNGHPVLEFNQTTDESAVFRGFMPAHYSGGGVTVEIHWAGDGVTTGNTTAGTDGHLSYDTVTFTDGADMDSVAAGDEFRLKLTRDAASDTMAADAQVTMVIVKET